MMLNTCTSATAAVQMFKSVQRCKAVTGVILEEFIKGKVNDEWVVKVVSHKTAGQGATSLTMDDEGLRRL